jgi:hypothetical protein
VTIALDAVWKADVKSRVRTMRGYGYILAGNNGDWDQMVVLWKGGAVDRFQIHYRENEQDVVVVWK